MPTGTQAGSIYILLALARDRAVASLSLSRVASGVTLILFIIRFILQGLVRFPQGRDARRSKFSIRIHMGTSHFRTPFYMTRMPYYYRHDHRQLELTCPSLLAHHRRLFEVVVRLTRQVSHFVIIASTNSISKIE
jgi:hypothetical protein